MIASYVAGASDDTNAKIVSYRTPRGRKDDQDLPEIDWLTPPSNPKVDTVLMLDTSFRTGLTAAGLRNRLMSLGFDKQRIWFVCMVACGITNTSVERAAGFSGFGDAKVLAKELYRPELNSFAKECGMQPDFIPHCIVYTADIFVKLPEGVR